MGSAGHRGVRSPDQSVWVGRGVTPDQIEGATRELERERYLESGGALPTRALNLVVIVDAAFASKIVRRLDDVGRNAPSRTILLRVAPDRGQLDARVELSADRDDPGPTATIGPLSERITIDVGARHVPRLESIVDPLVMADVPTLTWAPHGHRAALEAIVSLSQSVLIDSTDETDPADGIGLAHELHAAHELAVIDLAWLRATPWRLRLAAHYATAAERDRLATIRALEIRHEPGSASSGWLLAGWIADRLGWTIDARGVVDAAGRAISIALRPDEIGVRGLAGATLRADDGASFALDRRDGGLLAHRIADGRDDRWMLLGASRGEAGVLSAAFRRTLVPDDGYHDALAAARALRTADRERGRD